MNDPYLEKLFESTNFVPREAKAQGDYHNPELGRLSVVFLDSIDIMPSRVKPPVLNLKQSFTFPSNFGRVNNLDRCTQTSETCVSDSVELKKSDSSSSSEAKTIVPPQPIRLVSFQARSKPPKRVSSPTFNCKRFNLSRPMSRKRQQSAKSSTRRPPAPTKCPTTEDDSSGTSQPPIKESSDTSTNESDLTNFSLNLLHLKLENILESLHDNFWECNLQAIKDLLVVIPQTDWRLNERHLPTITRKLIDFLRSPRSMLVRVACQAAGEVFKVSPTFKRPEFDELTDLLLCKTADPNRFIQKDANIALDKLVTYMSVFHSVRALSKGQSHKNPIVRTATARLFVCIGALAGLDSIMGATGNTRTRKRILGALAKFLTDKCLETRKFAERLYKMLRKHQFFSEFFFKDMDDSTRTQLRRILITLDQRQ